MSLRVTPRVPSRPASRRARRLAAPLLCAATLALAMAGVGCGRPFRIATAPGFVELDGQSATGYDYRATSPEGVVMAVKVLEDEDRAELGFWTKSIILQMRDVSGYAHLATVDVTSLDGTPGKRMEFAHDEDGKPYLYWVTVFAAQGKLFIAEAGAPKPLFERNRASVEWTMKSLKVKCDTLVSPVLASRTCHRW